MGELKDMIISEIDGEYYAVPVGMAAKRFSGMIRLNETGKRIFELLMEGLDEDETVRQMMEEFDAEENAVRKNVHSFAERLREADLL